MRDARVLNVILLAFAGFCSACVAPALGKSCSSNEQPVCADENNALVCRDGFWASKSCSGGCVSGARITCAEPELPCDGKSYACESAQVANECTTAVVRSFPCRGPGGCSVNTSGALSCDMNGALEGDGCATAVEGRGICTVDHHGTLECRSGVMVKTNTCSDCTEQNGIITCTP